MIVDLSPEYKDSNLLVDTMHEEDALCWLWAFPSILPWPNPVAWLYTPVVGNTRWPGDLWGIDSAGDLLIIEAKQCKRRDDPFIDFLKFHNPSRQELSAVHWQLKWRKHLSAEVSSPNGWSIRPPGKTDGILPRSNKRSHLRRWPSLSRLIDDQIRTRQYTQNVQRYLQVRDQLHNPAPYYIALMIETDQKYPILTDVAKKSARALQTVAGDNHIGVIAVHCKRISDKKGLIEAWVIDWGKIQ
jgi:hypothetical protein